MSNLLDKSSIVLTASAYDNGKVLCVKPSDGSGDFDFSRNSAATRVNAQGLVEDVQILSSNLVQNGSFSQQGSEQITNGDFATDSIWTFGTGWSISGGTANCDGTQTGNSGLVQQGGILGATINFVVGKTYKVNFDVVVTSGVITMIEVASGVDLNSITSSGNHTTYITAVSTNNRFTILANPSFIGSVTNISVKEVGQNWTLGTGWSIGDNKAIAGSLSNGADIRQAGIFQQSKKYKISIDANKISGTNIILRTYNGSFQTIGDLTENSSFIYTTTATNNGTLYIVSNNFNGSITNIKIIEITDDTNLPRINYEGFSYQDVLGSELVTNGDFASAAGWSTSGEDATHIATFDGVTLRYQSDTTSPQLIVSQASVLEIGKFYKITLDVTVLTSGYIKSDNLGQLNLTPSVGTHTFYREATGTAFNMTRGSTNVDVTIDNVSVKEYKGQEVVPSSGCGHWLWENQSTNLITYSEDFSNAAWSKSSVGIINSATSPSGELDATEVDITNGNHFFYYNYSVSPNAQYTFSFYVKRGTATDLKYRLRAPQNNVDIIPPTSYYSQTSAGKWSRVSVNFTIPSDCSFLRAYILSDGGATGTAYLWGAQLEEQTYATSYIPTDGTQKTRNQDVCNNGGSLASINSTEGVLYFEGSALSVAGSAGLISLSDGTNSNRLTLELDGANVKGRFIAGGVSVGIFNYATDITLDTKIAFKYKVNDFSLWVDGAERVTINSGSVPSIGTLSELSFDRADGAENFFGNTKALAVWKEALSDEELAELTTI